MTRERRRRSRVSLNLPLTIDSEGKRTRGRVRDLSLKGLSCVTDGWIVPGKECDVTLELDSGINVHIHGRVVRAGVEGAVDFESMDQASFTHLRNLVRLYAADADLVDEELLTSAFAAEDKPLQG
ncbi:MAG: PilZ domain-containing protein [Desulfovibrionales bacterium]|nr:PilZ domain-containing protein [Desulfovibrionales bacterium]